MEMRLNGTIPRAGISVEPPSGGHQTWVFKSKQTGSGKDFTTGSMKFVADIVQQRLSLLREQFIVV
jgi:hypothetical protein